MAGIQSFIGERSHSCHSQACDSCHNCLM